MIQDFLGWDILRSLAASANKTLWINFLFGFEFGYSRGGKGWPRSSTVTKSPYLSLKFSKLVKIRVGEKNKRVNDVGPSRSRNLGTKTLNNLWMAARSESSHHDAISMVCLWVSPYITASEISLSVYCRVMMPRFSFSSMRSWIMRPVTLRRSCSRPPR